jgi:hypothetical protein
MTTQYELFKSRAEVAEQDRKINSEKKAAEDFQNELKRLKEQKCDHPSLMGLRVFLNFKFNFLKTKEDADRFMARCLVCLGGKSLLWLHEQGYENVIEGWKKEVALYRRSKADVEWLIRPRKTQS